MTTITSKNPGDSITSADYNAILGKIQTGRDFDTNFSAIPASYVISVTGATFYASPNTAGLSAYSGTVATTVFQSGINALSSGGRIFVRRGTYNLKSYISLLNANTEIIGEGRSSILAFSSPAGSTFTYGMKLKAFDLSVRDLQITSTGSFTNIIRVVGNGQRGTIQRCVIQGATPIATGQTGITIDSTIAGTYFWKFSDLEIGQIDYGIAVRSGANANFIERINFSNFNRGIFLDASLSLVSDIWGQTAGSAVVEIGPSGVLNSLVNINGESNTMPIILLDLASRNNSISNVIQSGTASVVLDRSAGGATNYINMIQTGQVGQITSAPPVSVSSVYNTFGTKVMVTVFIGTTQTNINKNAVFLGQATNSTVTVILNPGEWINFNQITGVSWTWWRI